MAIAHPPKVICHHIKDVDGPPFLTLRHLKLKLEYQDGSTSEEFTHDVVLRSKCDAAVIVPYDLSGPEPRVWLRSCVRPAVCTRKEFPNSYGSGWELPAGLVDEGELPIEAGIRELYEEIGFKVQEVQELGRPVWGSVGISPELLFFYCVDVTGLIRYNPAEDGSPLERFGECVLVSLDDALTLGDMKTDLGVHRLKYIL